MQPIIPESIPQTTYSKCEGDQCKISRLECQSSEIIRCKRKTFVAFLFLKTLSEKSNFITRCLEDPWREATLSSDFHTRASTVSQPIYVGNGFHCSDLIVKSEVDPTIKTVIDAGVATLSNWLTEWPSGSKTQKKPLIPVPAPPAFTPSQIPLSVASATSQAVPAVATQAIAVSAENVVSASDVGDGLNVHAVLDGMIRKPIHL